MNIAVVDDQYSEIAFLCEILDSYAKESGLSVKIDHFESGEEFLASFRPFYYQVIFLDIYMEGITGIETAASLRQSDIDARIIILTSSDVHMREAFDVHAFQYLIKFQDPEKFRKAFEPLITGEGEVFINNRRHEKYEGQPYFVSEFGGTYWNIDEDPSAAWGYGQAPKSLDEFYERFEGLISALLDNPKMCAFCYTQLTDVYQEKNGIYAFDRRAKFDTEKLHTIMTRKAAIEK